jgi:signal transduction histidine kinase
LAGVGGGIVVYLIIFGFQLDVPNFLLSLAIGLTYATVMWSAQEAIHRWMERHLPLRHRRDIVVRVALASVAITASFFAATALLRYAFQFGFTANLATMMIVGLVALTASGVVTGACYLDLFHRRTRVAEQQAAEAEFKALRAQIDPHFLFNTLNSIAALIKEHPGEAESVTTSLADLYRYSLRASHQPTVTLQDEIDAVRTYLTIETARFGDRLQTEFHIPHDALDVKVPSLILQPLVENAVKHGLGATTEPCRVTIEANRLQHVLRIAISDTGPGFDSTDLSEISQAGTGLQNVYRRLILLYDNASSMKIRPHGVEIRIPVTSSQ